MKIDHQTWTIPAKNVCTLVWDGDSLIDWAGGAVRYVLDGSAQRPNVCDAYPFDAACSSPSGEYAVLYERVGTKGIVLHRGKIIREINRDSYKAEAFEYPITIARLSSGQEILIHCPEEYGKLEIDDIAAGNRLTEAEERKTRDFFHSRLAFDGQFLLSAGWIWSPVNALCIYRLDDALTDPHVLDSGQFLFNTMTEISSAAHLGNGRIGISTNEYSDCGEEDFADPNVLRPNSLAIYDANTDKVLSQVPVNEPVGTMMKLEQNHIINFYDHPKVHDLADGQVVWRVNELKTGRQDSSIIWSSPLPPLALDPANGRFAVAAEDNIQVVKLNVCSL
jgi:hypothetical protein